MTLVASQIHKASFSLRLQFITHKLLTVFIGYARFPAKDFFVLKLLLTIILLPTLAIAGLRTPMEFSLGIRPIIGGVKVLPSDPIAASTVALYVENYTKPGKEKTFDFACSASIIADDLIVTAAHCMMGYSDLDGGLVDPAHILISFRLQEQSVDWNGSGGVLIKNYAFHAGYNNQNDDVLAPDIRNDLALIRFHAHLPPGYHPASLLSSEQENLLMEGAPTEAAGYGMSQLSKQASGGKLKKIDLPVLRRVDGSFVLLGNRNGEAPCYGDSGGPSFVVKDDVPMLWGVASHMMAKPYNCAQDMTYTDLGAYQDWIRETASELRTNGDRTYQYSNALLLYLVQLKLTKPEEVIDAIQNGAHVNAILNNPNLPDNGLSVLKIALRHASTSVIEILREHGAKE